MKSTNRFIEEHFHKTDRKYTFSNGSYIEFFSPESVLGARRNILYVNEANFVKFEDYFQLAIRTSDEIYIDYNPAAEFWCDTEVIPDEDCETLILTYKDNEALSESIVKELEKARDKAYYDIKGDINAEENIKSAYWANWWKVYGLGLVGTLEGVIFGDFTSIEKFPDDCDWICYGLDWGYTNDPTAFVKVGRKKDVIYLEQFIYKTGLTNEDINELIKPINIGRSEIIADNSENKSIEQLRRVGLNIRACVKGKDSINNGISLMKQYEFSIVSSSLELIKEWRGYSWKKDRATGKALNVPEDDMNHFMDAIRYVISHKEKPKRSAPRASLPKRR